MSSGGSLINLGELSKPATVLIERVSDAIGGVAKPWQIRRVAKAEADAEITRSQARIAISEIEERALTRMVREEGKRQENIESILRKAIPHLSSTAKPEEIDEEWLTFFFDQCKLASSEDMRSFWSKILAGEANKPGDFSRWTIGIVSKLDKRDAELFTRLCTFKCKIHADDLLIIYNLSDRVYKSHEISFEDILHLSSIGLVSEHGGHYFETGHPRNITANYYDIPIHMEYQSDDGNLLDIGTVAYTKSGKELSRICSSRRSDEFLEYLLSQWISMKILVSAPLQSRDIWRRR